MQIVIDIDENIYHRFVNGFANEDDAYLIEQLFKNGKILPKGHGKLIDADDLDITTITTDDYSGNEVLDVVLKEDIDSAQPIIEADKETENE